MTSLVSARNVSKSYGSVRAVDDVNFEVESCGIVQVDSRIPASQFCRVGPQPFLEEKSGGLA